MRLQLEKHSAAKQSRASYPISGEMKDPVHVVPLLYRFVRSRNYSFASVEPDLLKVEFRDNSASVSGIAFYDQDADEGELGGLGEESF